ncbi:MAG: 6-pyruvoyl-tetrahydropterin synthase-related protein, partial [Anaerolineae bacterium]
SLSLYLAATYAKALYSGKRSRSIFIALVISVSLALASHLLIGAVTVASVSLYLLFVLKEGRARVSEPFKLSALGFSLGAFWLIPLIAARPGSRFWGGRGSPLPLPDLFTAGFRRDAALGPLLITAALILLALRFLHREKIGSSKRPEFFGALLLTGLASLFGLLYITIGHLPFYPKDLYIDGLPPSSASFLPALSLALFDGLLLADWLERWGGRSLWTRLIPRGLIALMGVVLLLEIPTLRSDIRDVSQPNSDQKIAQGITQVDSSETNYRFGTDSAFVADWFSYLYDTPQTRDYFAQGVPYRVWQFWQEYTIWAQEDEIPTTNFLLDWFAIKWFLVGPPHYGSAKFLNRPQYYTLVSLEDQTGWYEFLYRDTSPILSATSISTALILGRGSNYDSLFRSLAHSNFNSQHVITLRGPNYLDDLTLDELSSFDLVVLYGFDYRDQGKAFDLLADYVRGGGGLIVEVNGSPLDNASSIPEPIPVSRATATNYGPEWNLTSADHEILEGIDLSAFSPAIYDGGPWGVSSAEETDIRDWAQPILFTNGHPIIVAGQYGQGRVVWTGMNLPYHILSYRNQNESRFLAQMIEWVAGEGGPQPDYEAQFIHPQKRVVNVLSPAKGVLFKESFFPNWHAYVAGRESTIYRAGPDFIYLPLPKDTPYPIEVILEYKKSILEWISLGISLITLLGLAAYAIKR